MTYALVRARGVRVAFGSTVVLDGVDLELGEGDEVALLGRSGSGKTTLLMVLAGLYQPDAGEVTWMGVPNTGLRSEDLGLIFQAPSLVPELTAAENVQLPIRLRGATQSQAEEAARHALEAVGLGDVGRALPAGLSGGQCQRVAVARALAGRPRLLLADEPTGALDRATARATVTALRDCVRSSGGALLVVTHDEEVAAEFPLHMRIEDGRFETAGRSSR